MDVVLDNSVAEVALPDGTIVQRSDNCDNGEQDLGQRGCAHFNNEDHTASVYLSYGGLDDTPSSKYNFILKYINSK